MISLSHRAIAFTLPVTTRHLVLWLGRIPNQVGWAPKLTTNQRDSLFYLTEGRRFHPSPLPSCPNSMHLPAEKNPPGIARGWEFPMAEMNHDQSIAIYSNLLQTQMKQLVGGFNHLEKYEFVNGRIIPYYPIYYGKLYKNVWNHQPDRVAPNISSWQTSCVRLPVSHDLSAAIAIDWNETHTHGLVNGCIMCIIPYSLSKHQ